MFKAIFKKKSKPRDLRFLDSESYAERPSSLKFQNASAGEGTEFIRVEKDKSAFVKPNGIPSNSFLEHIKHVTSQDVILEEDLLHEAIELTLPQTKLYEFDFDEVSSNDLIELNSLGIFSDSKIYSALIQSVLSNYHLNIQHFNHPNTFKPRDYPAFDSISSWIIFLSDENESDFLTLFLDRYVDKPTLFLFSKLNRDASVKRIEQFIYQHNLNLPVSAGEIYEINN